MPLVIRIHKITMQQLRGYFGTMYGNGHPVTTKGMDKPCRIPAHDHMCLHALFFIKGNLPYGEGASENHFRLIQKMGQVRIFGHHVLVKMCYILFFLKAFIGGQVTKIDGSAFRLGKSPISSPEIMETYFIVREGIKPIMGLYRQPGRS